MLRKLFDELPQADAPPAACAAMVAVGERSTGDPVVRSSQVGAIGVAHKGAPSRKRKPSRRGGSPAQRRKLANFIEAVASPHRLTILAKLMEGPATYRALAKATGLKVGPLYHHVNRLRMAALIAPKERDLYRMTRSGRDAMLILLAVLPLLGDSRIVD